MKLLTEFSLLTALVNAGVAMAGLLSGGFGLNNVQAENGGFQFSRRQTLNLPPECQGICNPVLNAKRTCTPASCCTSTFETAYYGCFLCVGGGSLTADYTIAQQALDQLFNTCASGGTPIPVLTFPGQDPNRPLSGAPNSSGAVPTNSSPSNPGANSTISPNPTSSSSGLVVTTDPPPRQVTITSLPSPTDPNTSPDPTDTAFAPPNSSGWKPVSGQWWAGMVVLTVGSLLGGISIL